MRHTIQFNEWLVYQKHKATLGNKKFGKKFIGERNYPHIDNKLHYPRIGNDVAQAAKLKEIICQEGRLESHGFLPFIKNGKRLRRFVQPPYDYEFSSLKGERSQKKFPHIKTRLIMYASHWDATILSFYSYLLQKDYEKFLLQESLENNVIAYRSVDGKNNVDFAKEAFDEMRNRTEYECIMLDVKGFFDNLNHSILHERWNSILEGGFSANPDHEVIFKNITRYRYLEYSEALKILKKNKRKFLTKIDESRKFCSLSDYNKYLKKEVKTNKSGFGIPQGSPISGLLANLYLSEFDKATKEVVVGSLGGFYQRYSDDILIICPIGQSKNVYLNISKALASHGLRLSLKKTEVFRKIEGETDLENITKSIDNKVSSKRKDPQYLGFHFNGASISFRSSTISRHLRGQKKADYMRGAYKKTESNIIARQLNKTRRNAKNKLL